MIPNLFINFIAHFTYYKEKILHAKAKAGLLNFQEMYGKEIPSEPNARAEYMEMLQNIQKTQTHVNLL